MWNFAKTVLAVCDKSSVSRPLDYDVIIENYLVRVENDFIVRVVEHIVVHPLGHLVSQKLFFFMTLNYYYKISYYLYSHNILSFILLRRRSPEVCKFTYLRRGRLCLIRY